jgi:pimeloyl-ACP methyl ester carboxylesterase
MRSTGQVAFATLMLNAVLCGVALADEPASRPLSFEVHFQTEDNFTLHGDLVSAADTQAPVVILLHMYRSDRTAWAPLVPKLAAAGFTVLALDQRAHGRSTRQGEQEVKVESIPRDRFGERVREGPRDVAAARRFLEQRGMATQRLALVGASYGCSVALLAARELEGVDALVLLSPGEAYFGVEVVDAARQFPGPLLAVAAEDDAQAARSSRRLAQVHQGEDDLVVYASGGHGTRLLPTRTELTDRIVGFLTDALSDPRGAAQLPK